VGLAADVVESIPLALVEPKDKIVRVGFNAGNLEFRVTTTMSGEMMSNFMAGLPLGMGVDDAELQANATFVGINMDQVLMLEVLPAPSADIIVPKGAGIITPDSFKR